MQPGPVADAAIRGMERNAFLIIPGSSGKALNIANRVAPWLVDSFLNRTIDKVRKERGA
jgi:hypothetical protein